LNETEVHQLCVLHRLEVADAVLGAQRQRWVEQDVVLVIALADDGEDDAVPAFDEIIELEAFMAENRIADIHPAPVDFLHDHEVLVAADVHQHDHGNADAVECVWGYLIAACTHAQAFHVLLHVEHGEPLCAH